MKYVCMECGAEVDYEEIIANKLKCTKCSVSRSNIWVKKRLPQTKTIAAR